ncbi:hypothetical protein Q1695_007771 [Nippostrongylus brasiliensis]|nr:hypothetical protein Q1695_007771 [Nippostrongylus brasiliensis]
MIEGGVIDLKGNNSKVSLVYGQMNELRYCRVGHQSRCRSPVDPTSRIMDPNIVGHKHYDIVRGEQKIAGSYPAVVAM